MKKYTYRYYCNDCKSYITVEDVTEKPTICINDPLHDINDNKTIKLKEEEVNIVDRSDKPRVHQTSRALGTTTCLTGAGDDPTDPTDTGNGQIMRIDHKCTDPDESVVYIDFNIEENETWIHEGYITWGGCQFDEVTLWVVPNIVTYMLSGITSVSFTGDGLNDCVSSGTYSGSIGKYMRIQIDGTGTPDTFKWSIDGGENWSDVEVAITGSDQELTEGIIVNFGATTGHTIDEYWDFTAAPNGRFKLLNYYLVVPATYPVGTDIHIPAFDEDNMIGPHEGIVFMPLNDLGEQPTGFWNAEWDATEKKYKNVTGSHDVYGAGTGKFNMFAVEVPLGRFVNRIPLTFNGFQKLQTSDTDQIGQGMRFKLVGHSHDDLEFDGDGLNDMIAYGDFHPYKMFVVEIDGVGTPNTFKWSDDMGMSWVETEVPITSLRQQLITDKDFYVMFGATTGHTLGDKWSWMYPKHHWHLSVIITLHRKDSI